MTIFFQRPGDATNLIVCGALAVLYLVALRPLERRHGGTDERYLVDTIRLWILIWLSWGVMYLVRLVDFEGDCSPQILCWGLHRHGFSDLLSDLVTVFLLVSAFFLFRGEEHQEIRGRHILLILLVSTVPSILLCVSFFLAPEGGTADALTTAQVLTLMGVAYSAAIAVGAPLLFGWIHSVRFGTRWVLGVAVLYALCQPLAHFDFPPGHKKPWVTIGLSKEKFDSIDVPGSLDHLLRKSETPIEKPEGVVKYTISLRRGTALETKQFHYSPSTLDERDLQRVIDVLKPALSPAEMGLFYLQARGRSLLYYVLAVFKVLLGWRLLLTFTLDPDSRDMAPGRPPPAELENLRKKAREWPYVGVAVLLAICVLILLGLMAHLLGVVAMSGIAAFLAVATLLLGLMLRVRTDGG